MTDDDKKLIDDLAQEIRRVDGNHSLGAGALAEALAPFIAARLEALTTTQGEVATTVFVKHLRDEIEMVSDPVTKNNLTYWLSHALTAAPDTRELVELLRRWESYGCPDCGGDCFSANPPVAMCIMSETRAALAKESK